MTGNYRNPLPFQEVWMSPVEEASQKRSQLRHRVLVSITAHKLLTNPRGLNISSNFSLVDFVAHSEVASVTVAAVRKQEHLE